MNLLFHSQSSANKFGGLPSDYMEIHKFLDSSKLFIPDWRHRCLLHNNFGIYLCERIFGDTYKRVSDGVEVCTRTIAETHIMEDLKAIPTIQLVLGEIQLKPWMGGLDPTQIHKMKNMKIPEGKNESMDSSNS